MSETSRAAITQDRSQWSKELQNVDKMAVLELDD